MAAARRLARVLLLVLMLVVGTATAGVIVSQTAWFKNWLRGYIVAEAGKYLNGNVSIERLSGNLFYGIELSNVGVSMDGSQVVAVENLGLDYNLFDLITKGVSIHNISLNRPTVYLRRDGTTWSIARLIKKQEQEADRQGPESPITIDDIGIHDGTVIIDPLTDDSTVDVPDRVEGLDAKLAFSYEPVRYSLEISHISFRASAPELVLNAMSGGISVKDDTVFVDTLAIRTAESSLQIDGAVQQYLTTPQLNLQVTSDLLSIPEVARVVPSLSGVDLEPAFEVRLNGPLDHLGVDLNVRSTAGQVTGQLTANAQDATKAVQGDVSVRHLDLAPILGDPKQKTDLTASAHVDLKTRSLSDLAALEGTASLRANQLALAGYSARNVAADVSIRDRRASVVAALDAYDARATTRGTVILPPSSGRPVVFDLTGRANRVNLAKLPRSLNVRPATTNLNADYHATGSIGSTPASRRVAADLTFASSTVPGAQIEGGSKAGVTVRGSEISYRLDATLNDLNLQQTGAAFDLPALNQDRFATAIDTNVVLQGSGTNTKDIKLLASGVVTDSAILGGRVTRLAFDANVADDVAHVTAEGSFAELDPSVASGRAAMKGNVAGGLVVDATISGVSGGVTPDNVSGHAQVNLEPSDVGGLALQSASLDADYQHQIADVRRLEIVGRDLNANASGTLALGTAGDSQLAFHADSPRLAEIGKLFDTPISGIAKVDGTLTGNRAELKATGTASGDVLKYENNGALSLDTSYSVTVPDLAYDRATVEADSRATFVTLGGQNIDQLSAKTTYADKTVNFTVDAAQPERTLQAGGSLILHPDHQEVHLTQLGLAAGDQRWTLPSDHDVTVNYAAGAIRVENLALTSGDQQITASGTFGRPGDAMQVELVNVDLQGIDALLLRPPQFGGRLAASATIGGTRVDPQVTGQFEVVQGAFRQFKYEALTGTIEYRAGGLTLDSRLQQNAAQWITAKGYLPASVFAQSEAEETTHIEPATPADRVDLTIESSPLDLGLVQGFTTAVTGVTGTFEAHVRLTGSGHDPHPEGSIVIANGGAQVVPSGVAYSHIAGKVDLQPDRVHIDAITLLDNHQNSLSISGDLAVHAREVGGFQIWINADDFKVVDNELGNVRIQSAVSLSGQLRSPIVQGFLGVTTGSVNLDEIIATVGSSPYPTQAAGDAGNTTAALANTSIEPAPSGPFDGLRMNMTLTIPDDLVVKASSLQTAGSPISLGSLIVTLGGNLSATKEPGGPVRLVGTVNTIRGNYDFQGRRFEILRDGTIRFEGTDEFNPRLDIRTRRVIQAVDARVNVRGTLDQPEIVLSSMPPLEQADILSLIVFNQPVNQLGEGDQVSLAQRAQSLAAGAVTGQLAQSIGKALNLDTFEIDVAPENGSGPQVTIGQQLGQSLYLKVQQGVGNQNTTNVVIEYELAEWVRLQTNVVEGSSTQQTLFSRNQGSGVDLIFTFSY
jgi:hypothetical protein